MPNVRPIARAISRDISRSIVHSSAFDPVSLFANGEQGAFYLPEPQYLYQDSAGTTPVAADGDPVGLMLDKSGNGNHASQATAASRPVYRTDGTLHWLENDLVDDSILSSIPDLGTNATLAYATTGGAVIVENRDYAGPLALPDVQKIYALVYLDRPLTATEKATLTDYLNSKAGVATQALAYGPGPETVIAGDMTTGFFGEVSDEEMFDGSELASDLGLSDGTGINRAGGWLKFIHNGVVKYIAKKPFRHSATWEQIYERGLVYGTDDNGKAPYGTPTNQFTKVRKNGSEFIVRLMTGANADPFPESDPLFFTADMYQMDVGGGSEWNDLIYRIHQAVLSDPTTDGFVADRHGGPQVGANWANYTDGDIVVGGGLGRASWCQEQSDVYSASRVHRGTSDVATFSRYTAAGVSSTLGWRPVLQLIPNN